ncbi:MAG: hypothetical protein ACFB51_06430, partial [Anaerolineae bacterium]
VLTGALAPTAELSGRDFNDFLFLQRMYDAGAADCFDVLSVQGYGLWSGPTDQRLRPIIVNYGRNQIILYIMVRNGDAEKAIWISEMNWNIAPEDVEPRYGRVSVEQQARWAPLAYQRAQEDWPWVGMVAFWYLKRADDQWLVERRPEAYFQMLEPDFTPLPVYETMAQAANQPPVMYPGSHPPDHWAIDYAVEPVTFTFSGTHLAVHYAAREAGTCGLVVRAADGPARIGEDCPGTVTWQGPPGEHTVQFELVGSAAIDRIIVRDQLRIPPLPFFGVLGVLLFAAVVLYPHKSS